MSLVFLRRNVAILNLGVHPDSENLTNTAWYLGNGVRYFYIFANNSGCRRRAFIGIKVVTEMNYREPCNGRYVASFHPKR